MLEYQGVGRGWRDEEGVGKGYFKFFLEVGGLIFYIWDLQMENYYIRQIGCYFGEGFGLMVYVDCRVQDFLGGSL